MHCMPTQLRNKRYNFRFVWISIRESHHENEFAFQNRIPHSLGLEEGRKQVYNAPDNSSLLKLMYCVSAI